MIDSYRTRVTTALIASLEPVPAVHAVWEGGSAANGTVDERSDLDLWVLASDLNAAGQAVEDGLATLATVSHVWRESTSIWPGMVQTIYFLEGAPEYFFVDVALIPTDRPELVDEFMQVERHGRAIVHLDRSGVLHARDTDHEALRTKQRRRLEEIERFVPVYLLEVRKELARGRAIDALAFYNGGLVRPLVELLGMVHRPARFDFGLRYVDSSFPEADARLVRELCFVADADALRANLPRLEQSLHAALSAARAAIDRTA